MSQVWSPNVITLLEALLTVLQYGLLLIHAYAQDKRWPYLSLPMWASSPDNNISICNTYRFLLKIEPLCLYLIIEGQEVIGQTIGFQRRLIHLKMTMMFMMCIRMPLKKLLNRETEPLLISSLFIQLTMIQVLSMCRLSFY